MFMSSFGTQRVLLQSAMVIFGERIRVKNNKKRKFKPTDSSFLYRCSLVFSKEHTKNLEEGRDK